MQKVIVAKDGSGQFTTIQAAIESFKKDNTEEKIVFVKNGIYEEKLFIEVNNIKIVGESKPLFGKDWANLKKELNKKPNAVYILASISRDIFRCSNNDDWGAATINIRANDVTLSNINCINTYGFDLEKEFDFVCNGETKHVRKDGHQFALRTMPPTQRLTVDRSNFYSLGGDTVSPWDVENGTYVFTNCTMEGGVDFYCPRGWAYADHCFFVCHNKNAAIWHDGTNNEDAKSVIKNSEFVGDPGYKLGRFHRDAQIYLINCRFSKDMADDEIYQVSTDNTLQWGKRIYYYDCKKKGVKFDWYKNNVSKQEVQKWDQNAVLGERWTHPQPYQIKKATVAENIDAKADRMVLAQRSYGGWPKTLDGKTQPPPYDSAWTFTFVAEMAKDKTKNDGTIDNGATTREITYLLKAYENTKNKKYLDAAEDGVSYLHAMQYSDGGFPQFFPDTSGYRNQITYNDHAMINALTVLRSVANHDGEYGAISVGLQSTSKEAVERGIKCILKTQIERNGEKTIWAAQYDKYSYLPAKARSYEHPSYATNESVGVIKFLMDIEKPSTEIIASIRKAVAFIHQIKITGLDYKRVKDENVATKTEVELTPNKFAKPLWARFYDIPTLQPIFSGRDGIIKNDIFEIENERRVHYGWYGYWGDDLIEKTYPRWHKKYVGPNLSGITEIRDTSYNTNKAFLDVLKINPNAKLPKVPKSKIKEELDQDYYQVEGKNLKMDIVASTNKTLNKTPLLIIHGGGWRSGDKSQHRLLAESLANKGYVCFLPQYRLSTEALFPAQIEDLRMALLYIKENAIKYNIDLNNLIVMGFSAGGQLASLLSAAQNEDKFDQVKIINKGLPQIKGFVDIDGITAFLHPDSAEGEDGKRLSAATLWFGATKTERPDLYLEASALTYANDKTPPGLFLASKESRMQAGWEEMRAILSKNNIYSDYYKFEGAPHSFILFEPWFTPATEKIDTFIKKITESN